MRYNYCPICGKELVPHHIGKLCPDCAKKQFKRKLIRTAVVTGLIGAAGAGTYYYVTHHKKEVAQAAEKLASEALALELKRLAATTKILIDTAAKKK